MLDSFSQVHVSQTSNYVTFLEVNDFIFTNPLSHFPAIPYYCDVRSVVDRAWS